MVVFRCMIMLFEKKAGKVTLAWSGMVHGQVRTAQRPTHCVIVRKVFIFYKSNRVVLFRFLLFNVMRCKVKTEGTTRLQTMRHKMKYLAHLFFRTLGHAVGGCPSSWAWGFPLSSGAFLAGRGVICGETNASKSFP